MNWRTNRRHLPRCALSRTDGCHLERLNYLSLHAEARPEVKLLRRFVELVDNTPAGSGELHRVANDGAEHSLEIESRADGLANFAQRFQFPNRPRQLAGPRLQFLKQSYILNRDHCLVGESFEELDLRWGEGAHLGATCDQRSYEFSLLTQRNSQPGAPAGGTQHWEIILSVDVGNVERAVLAHPAIVWLIHTNLDAPDGYRTEMSPRNIRGPLLESHYYVIDSTNPGGAFDNGVKDRLHVRGRAADDAEHLGRCRLMLQGLAQFRVALPEFSEQAHILDGDHCLVGEGLKKFDLAVSERVDLHPTNGNRADRDAFAEQRGGQHGAKAEPIHRDLALWELVIGLSR